MVAVDNREDDPKNNSGVDAGALASVPLLGSLISHECDHSFISLLPLARIFDIYYQGDPLSPTIFNVLVDNFRKRVRIICRIFQVVWKFWCQMRRLGPMLREQLVGGDGSSGQQGGRPEK